jgi:hypothetical protein
MNVGIVASDPESLLLGENNGFKEKKESKRI